jgi:hypothetical protein
MILDYLDRTGFPRTTHPNLIENTFSKLKACLRKAAGQSRASLRNSIGGIIPLFALVVSSHHRLSLPFGR